MRNSINNIPVSTMGKERRILLSLICLSLFTLHTSLSYSQVQKIDTVEFNVVTNYKPVIKDAVKLNENPATDDSVRPAKKADYGNFVNSQWPTMYAPAPLDAIYMKGEPLDKLQRSFFSAGIGNYNALYGEYFFNSLRSRDLDYGIHLNHFSSQAVADNSAYSGFAFNDINAFVEAFLHNHTLYAHADFDNQIVHDFGYNRNIENINNNDSTRVNYNKTMVGIDYRSNFKDSSGINHDLNVSWHNFTNVRNSTTFWADENNVNIDAHAFTYYNTQRIDIKATAIYYDDNDLLRNTNTWDFKFNPYFTGNGKRWDAHLGLKLFYDLRNGFNLAPDFSARVHIANDALMIFAGADGDKKYNSYESLVATNPYIQDTLNKQYSFTKIHLYGGLTGSITRDISYNLSGSQSRTDNTPLFMTNIYEQMANRFMVVYDNVTEINVHADMGYRANEKLKFTLSANYYVYNADTSKQVWYHPDFDVNLFGQYTLQKKFVIKAQVFVLGQQYAPTMLLGFNGPPSFGVEKENPYVDLNLAFDYHYNRFLTAFLNLNNLANVQYQRWLNYPTQGFNALVGVRLAF